ncbi:LysM peptidoglycan-binding domain-containing protein [Methylobacterium platani]|uniref:LysM domain-containing protein n=2 Tax=Methylobacterium platani TaxID=427683 RepID=A0A179SD71_9HYPH|nr:LysM peptidoglycan-binding domain-containing protein [Methylobacterium platani]KMO17157.1 hypothetical protein SQ03_13110 [Methylobacterium platani JCM 14648]OAS25800.1 hypothetical protein A5481_08170 [Methylobacterium platani]
MTTELRTTELRRGLALAAVGLVAGFVLIGVAASGTRLFSLVSPEPAVPGTPSQAPPAPQATAPAGAPAPLAALTGKPVEAAGAAPSFDVIRVEPDGASVVAGRSHPGAEVEVLRDGEPFARTRADAAGNFALVPPALPPGTSEITLRSTAPDGSTALGRASAVVMVAQDRRSKPLVAVTAPGQPTAVLSLPEAKPPAGKSEPPAGKSELSAGKSERPAVGTGEVAKIETGKIDTGKPGAAGPAAPPSGPAPVKVVGVDAEAGGRLYVTAQGAPKADLRLYLNDTLVAPGKAGPDGRVAFTIGSGVKPGDYRVRVDQVDPASGAVKTRAETAFAVPATLGPVPAAAPGGPGGRAARLPSTPGAPAPAETPSPAERVPGAEAVRIPADAAPPEPGAVFVPGISTATVTRGDNLWNISRKAYGRGLRYTVIFDANQGQIRDPNRIYPGQVFVLPGEAPQGPGAAPERSG